MSAGWWAAAVGVALVVVQVGVVVVALGVLPGRRKPTTAMAWLILVLAVPYLGIVAFAFLGSTSVGRTRREWQHRVDEELRAHVGESPVEPPAGLGDLGRLTTHLGSLPPTGGNEVDVLDDYAGSIAAMTEAVAGAQRFVHVEFYIVAWDADTDAFFRTLVEVADRGVDVRLLFDHLGSRGVPGYRELKQRLDASRIRWAPMLPIGPRRGQVRRPDLRNHRKIVVVDGEVGFIGSQNLIEPGYDDPGNHRRGLTYVELVARVRGPAVASLGVVFATDWYAETEDHAVRETLSRLDEWAPAGGAVCQVVPSGPGYATENNLRLFTSMLYRAQRRISLTSPYFVPDETLLSAVTTAAQRGVEVELFVSEVADQFMVFHAQRSYYRELLEAGVRIRLYPSPYVLHSKFFTVDDDLAVIGSSNLDYRSFALNYECVLLVSSAEVVERLAVVQDRYRRLSRELTLEEWRARPWREAYVDNVMRLTAALQ